MNCRNLHHTCCFLGHRTINETIELRTKLVETIENLIIDENVDTFLFGSKSRFDSLCLELVSELKTKYTHIKRIYIRAEFPNINDDYKRFLSNYYEDTFYPEKVIKAGKAVYIKRNFEMINLSDFCIVYYNEANFPVTRKSGSKIALDYALKKGKKIIMFPQ